MITSRSEYEEARKRISRSVASLLAGSLIAAVLGVNWMLQTGAVVGDAAAARAAEAKERYQLKQYEEALRLYRDALLERPESAALHFNTGDALYQLGKPDEALEQFERASATSKKTQLKADAFFNMGKTLFQQESFGPAAEAFKQVLEIDSRDIQAKLHLEMAQERLEEQQEQQQQQQRDGEERENGDENDSRNSENSDNVSQDRPDQEPDEREQGKTEPENLSDEERAPREAAGDNASSLDREEAERLLDALQDREKQAQLRRTKTEPGARGKDW